MKVSVAIRRDEGRLAALAAWERRGVHHLRICCPGVAKGWSARLVLLVHIHGLDGKHLFDCAGGGGRSRVLLQILPGIVIYGHSQDRSRGGDLVHAAQAGVWAGVK